MKFSIIIPVYNVEKYIEKCLMSVINQTYSDYEVIIVNDGTMDKSIQIAEKIIKDSHIENIKVINKNNGGLGSARNVGVKYSSGEYIIFIDSDDYISYDMLEKINGVTTKKKYDMILFDYYCVNENEKILSRSKMYGESIMNFVVEENRDILLKSPAAWNKVYRREFYKEGGLCFPENVIYEDTAITRILLTRAKNVCYINQPFYYYVQRESSIVHSSSIKKMMDILVTYNELYENLFRNKLYNEELEYIAIDTILFSIMIKINSIDYGSEYQRVLIKYVKQRFPNCITNGYLSIRKKILLHLILHEKYRLIYFRFGFLPKIKRAIKKG